MGEEKVGKKAALSFQTYAKPLKTSSRGQDWVRDTDLCLRLMVILYSGEQWCANGSAGFILFIYTEPTISLSVIQSVLKTSLGNLLEPVSKVTMEMFASCIFSDQLKKLHLFHGHVPNLHVRHFYTSKSCICVSNRHSQIQFDV